MDQIGLQYVLTVHLYSVSFKATYVSLDVYRLWLVFGELVLILHDTVRMKLEVATIKPCCCGDRRGYSAGAKRESTSPHIIFLNVLSFHPRIHRMFQGIP
jgi:hypothetical protein